MPAKKFFQCEECKNYFEDKDVIEVHKESGAKKKKIYVCGNCFKKIKKED